MAVVLLRDEAQVVARLHRMFGDDLSVLIGPRGETLDSLQFLSRLMAAHRLHRRANFVVDVEGFRKRREQALSERRKGRGRPTPLRN